MDLREKLGPAAAVDGSLSDLARGVVGSEILRIAALPRDTGVNKVQRRRLVGEPVLARHPL